jgi:hypothetical protein
MVGSLTAAVRAWQAARYPRLPYPRQWSLASPVDRNGQEYTQLNQATVLSGAFNGPPCELERISAAIVGSPVR